MKEGFVQREQARFLGELGEFLSIPSVSALPAHAADCRRAAEWLSTHLRSLGCPVVFDVTHSLQLPGAGNGVSAGLSQYIEPLASAGVAAGVDGVFLEVHEEPSRALSDGPNALPFDRLEPLLDRLAKIHALVKS